MRNYYFECYNEDGSLKYIPVNGICGFFKIKLDTHLDPKDINKDDCFIEPTKRVVVLDPQDIPDPWDLSF